MRFAFAAALGVALLLPLTAGAQSITSILSNINGDTFAMSVNPTNPAPYSQVTVSLSSDSLDLDNGTLSVSAGGKQIYAGSANSFSVQLGGAGVVTTLHATLTIGGTTYNQTLSIQPEDVVLIPEPISSAPPLYPGKPSVPLNGNVRVVAIANLKNANGSGSNPNTYSYVWTVDGVQQIDGSGIGKSSIIVPSPLEYRESDISVVVTDAGGNVTTSADLTLTAVDPSVRIYENDPLLGIRYDHALSGSYSISGAEATLYAAPFSLPVSNGVPVVQWFLNGTAVQTGNSVTLRPAGSGQGTAALSLTASGDSPSSASANLSLIFGAHPSTNLFGL
jgi:hypothetical protein